MLFKKILKRWKKRRFVVSCSFFQKGKRQVSGSSFWFENEIVDVILSNRFRKQNKTKRKFPFISKTKRNDNKKIKTCPTPPVSSRELSP